MPIFGTVAGEPLDGCSDPAAAHEDLIGVACAFAKRHSGPVSAGEVRESCSELLALYRRHWEEPHDSVHVAHQDGRGFLILVFDGPGRIARLATLGLGTCRAEDGAPFHAELLFVLGGQELGEIGSSRVAAFVADVAAHLLAHSIRPLEGSLMHTTLAPWEPDSIVFDHPRGEPQDLERFDADGHAGRLVWAVPLYGSEAELVSRDGLAALDALVEDNDFSLADVRRPRLR